MRVIDVSDGPPRVSAGTLSVKRRARGLERRQTRPAKSKSACKTIAPTSEGKSALRVKMAETIPGPSNVITRKTQEVFNFAINVHERDIVVGMEGRTVKGIGVVRGGYHFQADDGPFGLPR